MRQFTRHWLFWDVTPILSSGRASKLFCANGPLPKPLSEPVCSCPMRTGQGDSTRPVLLKAFLTGARLCCSQMAAQLLSLTRSGLR